MTFPSSVSGSKSAPKARLRGSPCAQNRHVAQRRAAAGHLFQAFSLLVTRVLCSADTLWAWAKGGRSGVGGGVGGGREWELEELNGFVMLES